MQRIIEKKIVIKIDWFDTSAESCKNGRQSGYITLVADFFFKLVVFVNL